MPPPVLLDATPLSGPHGVRGIGSYVRGLVTGFAALPPEERPRLLVADGADAPAGFIHHTVRMHHWDAPLIPDPRPARAGARRVWEIGPELFHATHPGLMPDGVPLVATCHDLIPLRYPSLYLRGPRALGRPAYMRAVRRLQHARLVLAPSQATAHDLVHLAGVPAERIRVIPHGAPAGGASAPHPAPRDDEAPYVLATQSLEPHKNMGLPVRAIARVRSGTRLKLAGPWSARRAARLRRLVDELGVGDRVDLLGYLDGDELQRLRAGAVAVLVPSLVEGFALPVLEAMSAGVPVLVSAGAGMDEAAGPEVPGLSCTDPGEWADTIDVLAGDPGERLRRIAIGTRRAAEFTWERCARSTADAYREALDA
ncbi:MAG: glycosyltransferase family 1 protein [Thermoleophilia bacterium]